MPIRVVTPSGTKIEVDTEQELQTVLRAVERESRAPAPHEERSTDEPSPWQGFVAILSAEGRGALAHIKDGPCTLSELREKLNLIGNTNAGGVMTGIVKAAKRAGLDPEDVFLRRVTGRGRKSITTFEAGPMLKAGEVRR